MARAYGKRIALFVLTNVAVLVVLSIAVRLLGVGPILDEYGIDYGALLVYAAIIGFSGALISLALSKWIAKRTTGARVIRRPESPAEAWLLSTVERLAGRTGIGVPEVAIYDSPDMNAFATGARRDRALVAVSTGLLRGMRREEAEAVLAHEISHVANGDMVTLTLLQGVVNTFVIFLARVIGFFVDRVVFRTERGYGPGFWITTILAQVLLGVLASMIVMWFSRRRELRADRGSGELVGAPRMIAALERLREGRAPSQLPEPLKAFGIRGGGRGAFGRLFLSHPPIEVRIARLRAAG